MTGIDDLFREYSEPDEFVSQYQLELFCWGHRMAQRARDNRHSKKPARKAQKRAWASAYYKRRKAEDQEWAAALRVRQNRLNREYRARKAAAGVACSRCPADRVAGKSLCSQHLEWERERAAKRRAA